jgi:hypothetical protein
MCEHAASERYLVLWVPASYPRTCRGTSLRQGDPGWDITTSPDYTPGNSYITFHTIPFSFSHSTFY